MNRSEPSWDLYRSFAAALREGSLSAAARALGLTQPTLARHIDALERAMGVTLFVRTQHGLAPTDAAQDLAPYVETLGVTAAALRRAVGGRTAAGVVRLTTSEMVGGKVLPPILAGLRRAHPGIVIELVLSNAIDNLLRRDADIAVRMVEPDQQALVVRRVGGIPLGLHAHRSYLETRGIPHDVAELAGHSVIGFDTETPAIRAMAGRMPGFSRDLFALRCDSDLAQFAAIEAGFGIGVCQVPLAARTGGLVRVLPQAFELALPTFIAMHEDLRQTPRCRVVYDALGDGLAAYIAGRPPAA